MAAFRCSPLMVRPRSGGMHRRRHTSSTCAVTLVYFIALSIMTSAQVLDWPPSRPDMPALRFDVHADACPFIRSLVSQVRSVNGRSGAILEIGSLLGSATRCIAEQTVDSGRVHVYASDPWSKEVINSMDDSDCPQVLRAVTATESLDLVSAFVTNMWPFRESMTVVRGSWNTVAANAASAAASTGRSIELVLLTTYNAKQLPAVLDSVGAALPHATIAGWTYQRDVVVRAVRTYTERLKIPKANISIREDTGFVIAPAVPPSQENPLPQQRRPKQSQGKSEPPISKCVVTVKPHSRGWCNGAPSFYIQVQRSGCGGSRAPNTITLAFSAPEMPQRGWRAKYNFPVGWGTFSATVRLLPADGMTIESVVPTMVKVTATLTSDIAGSVIGSGSSTVALDGTDRSPTCTIDPWGDASFTTQLI